MQRRLATAIFAYAGLSAALWGHATRWLNSTTAGLWCGNVVSDPYMFLVNVVGPLAAVCAVVLVQWCVKLHRWPCFAIAALLTFAVTSACLVYEGQLLQGEYGMPLGRIWWLPWR
jgi:hypothetical protein